MQRETKTDLLIGVGTTMIALELDASTGGKFQLK